MTFEVGQKVRLYGFEVWTVVQVLINFSDIHHLYYRIRRGCITMVVCGSSLTPYREV